jgi:hypothetical protein
LSPTSVGAGLNVLVGGRTQAATNLGHWPAMVGGCSRPNCSESPYRLRVRGRIARLQARGARSSKIQKLGLLGVELVLRQDPLVSELGELRKLIGEVGYGGGGDLSRSYGSSLRWMIAKHELC